ncbi:MAG: alpha-L-fucosidase [Cyclobacteriaceae bacterium]|nr:alpha-L-fucosidase [Cyclobacteriaceae bacterium]
MKKAFFFLFVILGAVPVLAQTTNEKAGGSYLDLNKPERLEWLRDAGFGMFIHFSFDSQLGIVISHSLVGASEDYTHRYFNELPETFNPNKFAADELAILARLAGIKYMVFTAKHHSGFCLWDTQTTGFNIMNTPYGKDLLSEYVLACRKYGLGVGFYYSPEDFHFLHENGQVIRRRFTMPLPDNVMEKYVDFTERQVTELVSNYGSIDVFFFDGGEGPLQEKSKEVVWRIQPEVLVTRGAIATPEQFVPGLASDAAWEACVTMGTQWQYKPTNENYKSGTRLIEILIESRAKGGTLLLNVGPKPNGELPIAQEERLREVAAWTFINKEAIEAVRPWIITNEDNIWFTSSKDGKVVYAFITQVPDWVRGTRREFVLHSVKSTENTSISVLGQSGQVVEYAPDVDASARFAQEENKLSVSVVRAQRIYNDHKWPNPIVVKLEHVLPALRPPVVNTLSATTAGLRLVLKGELVDAGDAGEVEVGFMYRPYAGFAENLNATSWAYTPFVTKVGTGTYNIGVNDLERGIEYEYRAVVRHPKIEIKGDIKRAQLK